MTQAVANVPKLVRGVDLAKVNLTTLNEYAKQAGLKFTAKDSVEKRVREYADIVLKEKDEKKLGDCRSCGGPSLLSLPVCPYCGTGETAPTADSPAASGVQVKAAADEAKAKPAASKAKPAATKAKPAGVSKPAAASKPAATEKAPALPLATSNAAAMKGAAKELDASVKRIKTLQGDAVGTYWQLGRALFDNYDRGLYKFRVDAKGQPLYKSWAAFCTAELNMSPQLARDVMAVATAFEEADVRKFGITKLKVLVRVPEEARAKLLEKAGVLSSRELEQRVQQEHPGATRDPVVQPSSRGGFGTARTGTPFDGTRKAEPSEANGAASAANVQQPSADKPSTGTGGAPASRPRIVSEDEIVLVHSSQRREIALYARNPNVDGTPRAATSVDDDPHGLDVAINGTETHYRLVNVEGRGLVLIIEHRKVDAAS